MSHRSLLIAASPHLAPIDSTPRIMWSVVASLVPVRVIEFLKEIYIGKENR